MKTKLEQQAALVANLRKHVDRLAGLIGPRHLARPINLAAAATLVERELSQSGYPVERLPFLIGTQEVVNIVAELPGAGRKEEIVILGAHYDTVPTTPGADDNASAVAVLLEVARLLRQRPTQRTVRFVAFPCEEAPHFNVGEMGSQAYAKLCRARGDRIVGMLCLEKPTNPNRDPQVPALGLPTERQLSGGRCKPPLMGATVEVLPRVQTGRALPDFLHRAASALYRSNAAR